MIRDMCQLLPVKRVGVGAALRSLPLVLALLAAAAGTSRAFDPYSHCAAYNATWNVATQSCVCYGGYVMTNSGCVAAAASGPSQEEAAAADAAAAAEARRLREAQDAEDARQRRFAQTKADLLGKFKSPFIDFDKYREWNAVTRAALRHQRELTRTDPANKRREVWCRLHIPLYAAESRASHERMRAWEKRCCADGGADRRWDVRDRDGSGGAEETGEEGEEPALKPAKVTGGKPSGPSGARKRTAGGAGAGGPGTRSSPADGTDPDGSLGADPPGDAPAPARAAISQPRARRPRKPRRPQGTRREGGVPGASQGREDGSPAPAPGTP